MCCVHTHTHVNSCSDVFCTMSLVVHVNNIFLAALDGRCTNLQEKCVELLSAEWNSCAKTFIEICSENEEKAGVDYAFAFLCLWNKMLKYLHLVHTNKANLGQNQIFKEAFSLLHVFEKCQIFQKMSFLCRKLLKTLNAVFSSVQAWYNVTAIPESILEFCRCLLENVNERFLNLLPSRHRMACFGGEMPEDIFSKQQTDKSCLQNVCLLIYKATALIAKSSTGEGNAEWKRNMET